MLGARDDERRHAGRGRGDGGIEIPGFLKREYLAFIGEEDVDQPAFDQAAEIGAVALDAEGVRKRQRDLAAGAACRIDRDAHRRARFLGVPEIAFEIEDRG
jgi:hypothetical protein